LKNLDSVFAAYLIGWAIFFLFSVSVAKRSAGLKEEISRLKERVQESLQKGK